MKTILLPRRTLHRLAPRLGRAAVCAALGLVGIFTPIAHAQTNTGDCFAAPAGLVGWWRAEGDAADQTLINNGNLLSNAPFVNGKVGQSFVLTNGGHVQIPSSPSLNVGLGAGLTIEGWIYPFSVTTGHPIAEWPVPGSYGVHFFTWNNGALYAAVVDTNGNYNILESSPGVLTANQWQHVALSYDKASGLGRMLVNGVTVAAAPLGSFTPKTDTELLIGYRPGTSPFGPVSFEGLIDELSLYYRALTTNEIAAIVAAGSAGKCSGNFTNPPPAMAGVPAIINFSPKSALIGSHINITGTNFSPLAASNIVYFGATRAIVSAASPTNLIVTLPAGAIHAPLTVTVNGRTAASQTAFLPTFTGTGTNISATSFASGQNLVVADGPIKSVIADIDNDGKPDLVEANAYAHNVSVFRSLSVAGTLDTSSFAPRVDLPAVGGTDSPRCIAVADVDGDGKLDILIGDQATSGIYVYQNISTPGVLNAGSFAPPVGFAAGSYPHGLRVADLNGDGLPEILVANYSGGFVSILRNTGSAGSLTTNSFAPQYALVTGPGPTDVGIADLNGDGRRDLVATAFDGSQLSLFRNVANPTTAVSNWFTLDTALPALPGSLEITVTDMDGDAKSDLVIASVHGYAVSIYRNQATAGAFTSNSFAARLDYSTPGWAHSISVADFNGDAKPDLAVVGELNSYLGVFQNQSSPGNISLAARVDFGTGWNAWGVAAGDLDGDNRADIVFANSYDDTLTFYRNIMTAGSGTNQPSDNCVTVPGGAISWWRGEGDALDAIGIHHGTPTGGAYHGTGRIGQAFDFDGDRDGVSAGTATNLQLQDFTVEAWIKRRSDSVISFNGNGNGQLFSVGAGGGGSTFYLQADSRLALGKLQVNVVTSDAMVTDTNWHHIAVTKQGTTVRFFVDGVAYAAPAYDSGEFTFNGPAYIGAWLNPSQLVDNTFYGAIDELAVYNRALTTNEIAALYNASGDGKCVPAATSPVITQHPQDTLVIAGGTAQFAVTATGVPALSYQWYFQNNPLPGQTSPTLVLNQVLPDKQGTYSVQVSNPSGSLFSSNATLTVVTTQAVALVDGATAGFYNEALGTILDGTAPQFPLPFGQGDDPTIFPADEPNLAAATNILGHWLATPPALNSNWQAVAVIPDTWALNTETAIIYPVDAGIYGIVNLRGDFDADNGIYVWVNGQFKFGARAPGLPSPAGLFEYTNVFLGNLPPGTNYIQILREDSGITAGSQIRLTGTTMSTNRQPPSIVQSPTNQTVAAGSSALFTVVAEGTPELSYQWRFEGADLTGQTGSTLSLLNVQPAHAGNYSVLVSNPYGSVTSAVATLTVLTYPPNITSQPPDRSVFIGQTTSFSVTTTGTAPLRYYWSANGSNLPAATISTLTLQNIQTNAAGFYQVIVSNAYGTMTSRLAQLTVLPPPPCTPAPDGVIAWWPGQSNLWDVVGGFDATLYQTLPYSLYTTGKVGATLNLWANQNYAIVRTGGGLNVNTGSGLTIEGWVRPNSLSGAGPIAEWSDGRTTVGAGLLLNSAGQGTIEATLTDTNLSKVAVTFRSAALAVTNGLWQHVALTYNKSNGLAIIYVNGSIVAQTNAGIMNPTTSGDVYLGYRAAGTYAGTRFNGTLDEITLYNRALTEVEVQGIVAADLTGKCPPLPPACVTPPADIVAWWRGESNTVDQVAGNDAIRIPTNYPANLAYQTGQIGMAFRFNPQNFLTVPRSETLDAGAGSGLTVEGWIYPNSLTSMPIVEWTDTNSYGANLWMSYSRGPTILEANLIDNAGGFHLIRSPLNTIRGYSWQHVAVTYDKTTGIAALYSDGALVVSTNLGFFTPRTSTDLLIGFHPRALSAIGDGAPPTTDRYFNGAIDELAVYRRALTAAEIRHVARPRPGKCLELPPTIGQHPQPQVSIAGGNAQFALKVGGTAPFQYQWLFAGQPIGGATNANLSLSRLDMEAAGLYSVRVSNLFGSATSRAAELTVLPADQCLPMPYGAVAFWRGESNVVDELGRHPAAWGSNTVPAYISGPKEGGKVGTAFRFNGANHLQIPSDADLNVGAGGGFTIEGWVKPDSLFTSQQPIWDWSDSKGNIGVGLMLGRTGPGVLEVTLTDTNASNTAERIVTLTTPTYTIGSPTNALSRWFHIALTFDKAARNVALYVDGRLVVERSVPLLFYYTQVYSYQLFSPATTGNLYFGWRPYGTGAGSRFRGAMDEMSVYYRALTSLELQAIYLVGANGKCAPTPSCQTFNSNIISWWRGESNVLDSVDGNHGLANAPIGGPGISYTNGIVGSGFKTASGRYVQVPASPSLNVGASTGLTFETWFKLDSANSSFALASWNLGSTQGVYIGTSPTHGASYLEANLIDTAGKVHALSWYTYTPTVPGGLLQAQKWHHLAVTYNKPSGQAILYLNGSPVAITNLGSFTPRTTGVLNLGSRPQTSVGGATLTGVLDETTLYNRALSSSEITANYRNVANRCMEPPVIVQAPQSIRVNPGSNVTFAVVATGSPLLRYQWSKLNGPITLVPLSGQTNATLSLTNVQAKDAGSYWIRVTNAFGSATSSNINLIVNRAPTASNLVATVSEDGTKTIALTGFDPDFDLLTFEIVTRPNHGRIVIWKVVPPSGSAETNLITAVVYNPYPNYFGPDSFTFKANDGLLDSLPATVAILVTPVNDPPTAGSQIVITDEDTPLPLTLAAADADGDVLTFQITPPAHGTLSGTAPNLVYTPHANYFGDDLLTYTVKDGSNAVSELAAISITVRPINDPPVARLELAPLDELPGVTNLVSIAPVCCAATLRLDASQSGDVENEPLSYAWLIGTNVVSAEAIVTNRLAPGTYEITLIVSDGTTAAHQTRTVEIITATETVDYLIQLVEAGVTSRNLRSPLLNWLRETGKSFDRCHVEQGVHFLELFRDRVADRIQPTDPELAQSLMDTATAIIEAAPDCDPCHRLGRKDRKHGRDHDRDDRDGRNGRDDRDRHDDRDNDRNDRNRSGDRKSDERGQDDRESKSERAVAPAAPSSQAELRPVAIETGAVRSPKSRE